MRIFVFLLIFSSCMIARIQLIGQGEFIFVSTTGSDKEGSGTIDSPFATLDQALVKLKQIKKIVPQKSINIYLREGTYYRTNAFRLTNEESGTISHPLTISAYKDEHVVLNGGVSIDPSLAKHIKDSDILKRLPSHLADSIYEVDLKAIGINEFGDLFPVGFARPFRPSWSELFVNSEPTQLARWPNDTTLLMRKVLDPGSVPRDDDFSNRGGKFVFKEDRPLSWKFHDDMWISGYFKYGYAEDAVKLANIDPENHIFSTVQPTLYGFGSGNSFNRWYAYNILEEIDKPGEYFLDRKVGKIYFYPGMEIKKIELSQLDEPLISLRAASNVMIENIVFENSRGMGVYMDETENNRVVDCVFRNLGLVGVSIGKGIEPFKSLQHSAKGNPTSEIIGSFQQHLYHDPTFNGVGGKNNGVINCHIYNMGAGGVHLSGGDRLTLVAAGNFVENCEIHDFNRREKSYRAGIDISGVGNIIRNCELYNAPSMAILMHGNDHVFEYNNVHDVCQEVDDQGALYYGRDASERGHMVRYNYFHDIQDHHRTTAVYHDDGAGGMEVFGNIFYKAGSVPVLIGGGMDNTYTNNIFVDLGLAIHVDSRYQGWAKGSMVKGELFDERLQLVDYLNPPYSTRYPELINFWDEKPDVPKRNIISGNLFYKVKKPYRGEMSWMPFTDDNWVATEDPGFVNIDKENFALIKDALVFKKIPGFKNIPVEKIGIQNK